MGIQAVNDSVYTLKNVRSDKYLNVDGYGNVTFWDNIRIESDASIPRSWWEITLVSEDGLSNCPEACRSGNYTDLFPCVGMYAEPACYLEDWVWESDYYRNCRNCGNWVDCRNCTAQFQDIYTLKSFDSEMYLNVLGGWSNDGANVHMWDNPQSNHSQWRIVFLY